MPVRYVRECPYPPCQREATHYYVEDGVRKMVCGSCASEAKAKGLVFVLDTGNRSVQNALRRARAEERKAETESSTALAQGEEEPVSEEMAPAEPEESDEDEDN